MKRWILVIVLLLAMITAAQWISKSNRPPQRVTLDPMSMRPEALQRANRPANADKPAPKHAKPSVKDKAPK